MLGKDSTTEPHARPKATLQCQGQLASVMQAEPEAQRHTEVPKMGPVLIVEFPLAVLRLFLGVCVSAPLWNCLTAVPL